MSDELKIGISDLVISDDLDIEMDAESYQDQASPAPPPAGTYAGKILNLDLRRDQETKQPVLRDDKWPTLVINTINIVEGLEAERKVVLFQEVGTKPFDRYGTPASGLGDLTRAFDQTRSWRGLDEGMALLREFVETGQIFVAQYNWAVKDGDFVKAAFEQLGVPSDYTERNDDQKKLANAIYNASRVRGQGYFPYDSTKEKFSHVLQRADVSFKNPLTGANVVIEVPHRVLEARLEITKYVPSKDAESGRVKLGPSKVKVRIAA